ncbi:MAG: MerR family DNA-binding protein [Betaproteobacteria bacterium]
MLPVATLPAVRGANYRGFGSDAEKRLRFVRHCRALGIDLGEIRRLLGLADEPDADCGEVNALLDKHLQKVREQQRELALLERQLKALRDRCHRVQRARDCGILRELA